MRIRDIAAASLKITNVQAAWHFRSGGERTDCAVVTPVHGLPVFYLHYVMEGSSD